jgi:hypothetical protein
VCTVVPIAVAAGALTATDAKTESAAALRSEDVAVVGDRHITKTLFESAMRVIAATARQGTPMRVEALRGEALRLLVQSAQQEKGASDRGIHVTPGMISNRIAAIRQKYFHDDAREYKAEIKREGLSMSDVRLEVRAELTSQLLQNKVSAESDDSNKVRAMTKWVEDTSAVYCAEHKITLRRGYSLHPDPCAP